MISSVIRESAQYRILRGDALAMLRTLPDESVHCCVTSPPYFGLRDYGTATWVGGDEGCEHKPGNENRVGRTGLQGGTKTAGHKAEGYGRNCPKCGAVRVDNQIGLEETPEQYVARLVDVFREVRRVLRRDGTLWLNIGDSYANDAKWGGSTGGKHAGALHGNTGIGRRRMDTGLKPKDLIGIPWRLAFALQADGWWLRSDVIWCLSGGTVVYARTQKGDMPMTIKDMARLKPETVQLWNGEKWTQLLGTSMSQRQGTELEIVLRSGERISCTPTHKFPTQRGLLVAGDLRIGDKLQRVELPEPEAPQDSAHMHVGAAWFAGLYIAEGSRSGDAIRISGHAKEEARWQRVRDIAKSYGCSATRTISGNNMSIRVYGKMMNAIVDTLVTGRTAIDKGFAPVVWRYSNGFIDSMLAGYLSGDGHWDTDNNRWRLGFVRNYNLERDLRTACARLGYQLTLKMAHSQHNGMVTATFRGEIRLNRSGHHNEKDSTEIVELRKARCRQVYDLGVADEPHVFALASGILTHNSKPNPMPESVTDRPTKAHEYLFLLTKAERYFYDAQAIAEASVYPDDNRKERSGNGQKRLPTDLIAGVRPGSATYATRNRRSVWTVATEPTPYAHFATMPTALVEPCVMAGTSAHGVCPACGAPWARVVERESKQRHELDRDDPNFRPSRYPRKSSGMDEYSNGGGQAFVFATTTGWTPTCACRAGAPVPATVLDPFAGSGTTLRVAIGLGRSAIGIELNPEYAALAERLLARTQPALLGV